MNDLMLKLMADQSYREENLLKYRNIRVNRTSQKSVRKPMSLFFPVIMNIGSYLRQSINF